jgi:Na+-transporting NADH:ubiquinone oxidoreductase subunit NqrE
VINVPGVWGVIGAAFCLARFVDIGFGLIAVYLTLVNALVHIASSLVLKRYNPGLASAVAVFLPVGGFGLWQIVAAGGGTAAMQALGLGSAVGTHLAIVGYARLKNAALIAASSLSAGHGRKALGA